MATQNPAPPAVKTPKARKPAPSVSQRVTDLLKRGALQGKVTEADLEAITALAASLKVFLKA